MSGRVRATPCSLDRALSRARALVFSLEPKQSLDSRTRTFREHSFLFFHNYSLFLLARPRNYRHVALVAPGSQRPRDVADPQFAPTARHDTTTPRDRHLVRGTTSPRRLGPRAPGRCRCVAVDTRRTCVTGLCLFLRTVSTTTTSSTSPVGVGHRPLVHHDRLDRHRPRRHDPAPSRRRPRRPRSRPLRPPRLALVLRADVDAPAGESRGQSGVLPSLPMARESCWSCTITVAMPSTSSRRTSRTRAGWRADWMNSTGSSL